MTMATGICIKSATLTSAASEGACIAPQPFHRLRDRVLPQQAVIVHILPRQLVELAAKGSA